MSDEEWAQIYFDNVFVPADGLLLKQGGFKKLIAGFNVERIGNAARSLALGRYAYEAARQWAMQRKQFGRLLCEFQGLQWKFADMKIKLDAGQLLLYRASANADRGFPSAEETAIAKAYCNQAGFDVASEALQVMGGLGYSQEELVEYCLRRCRGWMIAGGSIEIQPDRKSTRLNSSHRCISYAVFCLKKKSGPSYRSEIFYETPDPERAAPAYVAQLATSHVF